MFKLSYGRGPHHEEYIPAKKLNSKNSCIKNLEDNDFET